ncbi:MAG TPA: hypothetical protein VFU78_07655, partial [Thermomicrobiales bacterium]|nr:hypothetical protein [Thermomicrobiales bacterium]
LPPLVRAAALAGADELLRAEQRAVGAGYRLQVDRLQVSLASTMLICKNLQLANLQPVTRR